MGAIQMARFCFPGVPTVIGHHHLQESNPPLLTILFWECFFVSDNDFIFCASRKLRHCLGGPPSDFLKKAPIERLNRVPESLALNQLA